MAFNYRSILPMGLVGLTSIGLGPIIGLICRCRYIHKKGKGGYGVLSKIKGVSANFVSKRIGQFVILRYDKISFCTRKRGK